MKIRQVEIIEQQAGGWRCGDVPYRSAAEALQAVKNADLVSAKATGSSVATVVTWVPCTRIGRIVAQSLGK